MRKKISNLVSGLIVVTLGYIAWGATIPMEEYMCFQSATQNSQPESGEWKQRKCENSLRCGAGRAWGKVRAAIGNHLQDENPIGPGGGIRSFADLSAAARCD